MARSSESKAGVARGAWTLLFDFFVQSAPRRTARMGKRGLSPNDMRALATLAVGEGRTMRSLADDWRCDASNATLIVNRLEKAGYVARRAMAGDARYRVVELTAKGRRIYAELVEEFHTPPAELLALSTKDLDTLRDILARIPTPTRE
jgi:DNA-binding MarR family transcriptional regulator